MSSLPRVDRALVHKFFAGQCSAAEQEVVRAWLLDPANEPAARAYVQDIWNDTPSVPGEADTDALLRQTWERIAHRQNNRGPWTLDRGLTFTSQRCHY